MLCKRLHTSSNLERLEDRRLLAANLVGHWTADELNATMDSGEPVAAWMDAVANISATAEGEPRLIENALNGHSVVRFTPSDGIDLLRVDANESPMAGVDDFSIAVVFSTSSSELDGEATNWYLNSGLVDTNLVGFVDDWGLAINGLGQVAAGLGRPVRTQYSTLAGLNDGGAHVAIYTRNGGTITLYTDGTVDARADGGTAPRAARDITFGALQTRRSPYDGDIAEVRLYDTQLTSAEANNLTTKLLAHYFNLAPTAIDDAYTVDEDATLVVTATDGVLANDLDSEQDPFVAVLDEQPQHGTLELFADGSFAYQPTPNFQGEDVFSYMARDQRNSEPALVRIQVLDSYDPPIAVSDTYLLIADRPFSVGEFAGVLSNDVNLGAADLTAALVEDVRHGELTLGSDGRFDYTPDMGFVGRDTFLYEIDDGTTTAPAVRVELVVNKHTVTISEVATDNRGILIDEDGDSPDWIELFNYGEQPVDLDGWFLTDDPDDLTGWRLPAVSLTPGQFLTVFASGKDRTDVAADLHANFKLSSSGEYLALVANNGDTIISEFAPSIPPQFTDVSFGPSMSAVTRALVNRENQAQVLVPANDSLGQTWTETAFQTDASWSSGTAAIGFDTGTIAPDSGQYASAVSADGPVGYWRLEEASGTLAENSGSLGPVADGDYLDGVTQNVAGVLLGSVDRAARFQQDLGQKIDVPFNPGLNPESFSFEVWARVDGGTGYRSPLTSRGDSPQEGFLFYATPSNTWQMWTGTGQQVGWTVLAGPPVQAGKWTHLVGTYDDTTQTQRFYVDGIAVASVTNFVVTPNDSAPLRIGGGATEGDGTYFFEGAVDEVAIYDHVLTAGDIRSHFDAARTDESADDVAEYDELLDHDVEQAMLGVNTSAFVRIPFEANGVDAFDALSLDMMYDDGFVAYINGERVASRNAPSSSGFDVAATTARSDQEALVAESFDLSEYLHVLNDGNNVLAIHGLNSAKDDGDFLIAPTLTATAISLNRFDTGYFSPATPGAVNTGAIEMGPIVGDVRHEPVMPASGEDLTVSATIHQLRAPSVAVTLTYRAMYGDEFSTFMVDDGSIGGDVAGDGIYTGVISADQIEAAYLAGGGVATDLAGTMLRYRISTLDVEARAFSAPYLANPSNANGFPEYLGTVIQSPTIDTPLPVFHGFVPDPEWHKTGNGNNKNWSPASVFFDGEFYDNVQVRVRGQTTVSWSKPKFKFEFNRGHEFRYSDHQARVDEFNLLSHFIEKGAVSYMGENLAFQFLQDIGVAAPNTFHMHVRQNGDFYSLASFIEQIDATFLERNGFDPHGPMYKANSSSARSTLAPNPTASHYRKVTEKNEPWDDVVEFTNGINNLIPGVTRTEYIFDHVNLPEVINDMAGNVILINHDRLTKNYYMYHDQHGNGEWSRFPWDMDQAFAIRTDDIFASVLYGDSEHPQSPDPIHQNHLYDAILDTPFTREMYLQRIRTLIDDFLGAVAGGYFEQTIDAYHGLIADDAALDHAKWGAGNIAAGVSRLKNNLQFRRTQLEADPLVPDATTRIDIRLDELDVDPTSGNQDEEYIEIQNFGQSAVDVSGWSLSGGVTMRLQPGTVIPAGGSLFVTPDVVAFRARTSGPSGGQALFVQGNYEGRLSNFGELVQLMDGDGNQVDTTTTIPAPTDVQQYLRISEIHYNPAGTSDTEFIEFTNISSGANAAVLDLAGVTISRGPNTPYVFPSGATLAPGGFLLVVEGQAAFRAAYANVDTALIVGEYTGGLANGGERIKLDDANGNTVVSFEYQDDDPWPVRADGAGASLELVDAATPREQFDKYYHWRASSAFGGSPGTTGAEPIGVVVNEVRTGGAVDEIELLNTTEREMDISGWYLSDSGNDLLKFAIPAGTVLGAGQYVVFDERDFNPTPANPGPKDFGLSSTNGDDVWLVITDGQDGVRTFVDDVHFGPATPGETIGRTPNGSGRFTHMAAATIGCENAHPRVGPVVISEFHYSGSQPSAPALSIAPNLTANDLEFIELYNPTDSDISLSRWRLRGGIELDFAEGTNLAPRQVLLVVPFDPSDPANANQVTGFKTHYGIEENVTLTHGYSGSLSNSGEVIRLEGIFEGPIAAFHVQHDEVLYDDLAPWPAAADADDSSLQRLGPVYSGNSADSWTARAPSPGSVSFPGNLRGDFSGDGVVGAVDIDILNGAVHSTETVSYFDLDGNSIVDFSDATMLVEQVIGTRFGDANLDGVVDGSDFNNWNEHKFEDCFSSWADGDFTGDGSVDGSDFNVWMNNRFTGGQPMAGAGDEQPLRNRAPKQPLAVLRHREQNAPVIADSLVRPNDAALGSDRGDSQPLVSDSSDFGPEFPHARYSRRLLNNRRFESQRQTDDTPERHESSTIQRDQLFTKWPHVHDLSG